MRCPVSHPGRGQAVFFGRKVACSTCHRIGGKGGQVGPDLTRIAAIRSGRDLLESIVFPGSTFARGYENYLVSLEDGRVVAGLIARILGKHPGLTPYEMKTVLLALADNAAATGAAG